MILSMYTKNVLIMADSEGSAILVQSGCPKHVLEFSSVLSRYASYLFASVLNCLVSLAYE